jgi:hypothetical protein
MAKFRVVAEIVEDWKTDFEAKKKLTNRLL